MRGKIWEVGSTWYRLPGDSRAEAADSLLARCVCHGSLLSTCRSAISCVLDRVSGNGVALVPGFTCHSVVRPFTGKGYRVWGYPVKEDLTVDWDSLADMAEALRPSVILLHGYFGFGNIMPPDGVARQLKAAGTVVVEDQTQNMFSDVPRPEAAYRVGSVRKWGPVPDGAFLEGAAVGALQQDAELVAAKMLAMDAKGAYIAGGEGDKAAFMRLFSEAESLLDGREEPFAVSGEALSYLASTDRARFISARKDNYVRLATRLARHGRVKVINPSLRAGEVPFMLPVLVESGRGAFQKHMASHGVYPTVIWGCPDELEGKLDPTTRSIYDSILCFHIDQRYDTADMDTVADIADAYFTDI